MKLIEPPIRRRAAGFTLVELLVVISIIAVLIGFVTVVSMQLQTSAKGSLARTTLAGLEGVSSEYEVRAERPLEVQDDSSIYDWSGNKTTNVPGNSGNSAPIQGSGDNTTQKRANLAIERFVYLAYKIPACREALERLGENALVDKDNDGFLEVRDPWGECFAYAARVSHDDGNNDDDYLPEYGKPFFGSAGPDHAWGNPPEDRGDDPTGAAADNLYTFEIR